MCRPPSRGSALCFSGPTAPALLRRVFAEDALVPEVFALDLDPLWVRAARRRSHQDRRLVSVTDLFTALVRRAVGMLVVFLMGGFSCNKTDKKSDPPAKGRKA